MAATALELEHRSPDQYLRAVLTSSVTNDRLRSILLALVLLLVTAMPAVAGQAQSSVDQTTALEIRVTASPRWQDGCLHVTYEIVNRTAATLWLPMNGSRVNAAVRRFGTSAEDGWVSISPFFDNDPQGEVPMVAGHTDYEEPCFPRTFHVTKAPGGRGRDIPLRAQIQLVVEYFTEQAPRSNKPHVASIVVHIPCFPGEQGPQCDERPILKAGEGIWWP